MQNSKIEFILLKLRKSKFRAKFHLKGNDKKYINREYYSYQKTLTCWNNIKNDLFITPEL